MAKKLSKAERLIDGQMLAIVEWAADHPKQWHNIGKLEATQRAAELLEKRGVSTSIGVRGAHITVGHGQVRETVGLPGHGLELHARRGCAPGAPGRP